MVLVAPLVIACGIGLLASVVKVIKHKRNNQAIRRMNDMKVCNRLPLYVTAFHICNCFPPMT